jgi:hypothetical protein
MFNCIAKTNNLLKQDLQGGMIWTKLCSTTSRSVNRQDYLVVEVGPDDRSVLYMQEKHCSDDI